ncbi:MAG TPA: hypothetical protein VHC22_03015 [Pirellulales bacterium]|nr:hypothetical protein [Pirellulales bacterium]
MATRFQFYDARPEDQGTRQLIQVHVDRLLRQCREIPVAYWPHLVNRACQRLADRGADDTIVRRIYRRTVRELRLRAWP